MTIRLIWDYVVLFASITVTPALTISYIPQIMQLYKTKSAKDINKRFWYIMNFALTMTTILAIDTFIDTGSIAMLIAQGLNLFLAVVVLAQVKYYQKKEGVVQRGKGVFGEKGILRTINLRGLFRGNEENTR